MIDDHLPNLYLAGLCEVYLERFLDTRREVVIDKNGAEKLRMANLSGGEHVFLRMLRKVGFSYVRAKADARIL